MASNTNQVQMDTVELDMRIVDREAKKLADKLGVIYSTEFKLALIRARAIATAKTLQSVKPEFVLDSPSRGMYLRNVVAKETWKFIQSGRRAGANMPPLSAMIEWFRALGIPKSAWFPIRVAIARRGIKPRNIIGKTMREAQPLMTKAVANTSQKIAKSGIIRRGANAQN